MRADAGGLALQGADFVVVDKDINEALDLALTRVCDTIERDLLGSSSLDLVLASTARFPDED